MTTSTTTTDAAYKKLLAGINGFSGYEQPGLREKTDISFRHFLINEIGALIKYVKIDFSVQGSTLRNKAQKLKKGILVLSESLKHPTYHGAFFFNKDGLRNNLLDQIYECEMIMYDEIETLKQELELLAVAPTVNDLENLLIHIQDFIDNFNQHVFERESLILEA